MFISPTFMLTSHKLVNLSVAFCTNKMQNAYYHDKNRK